MSIRCEAVQNNRRNCIRMKIHGNRQTAWSLNGGETSRVENEHSELRMKILICRLSLFMPAILHSFESLFCLHLAAIAAKKEHNGFWSKWNSMWCDFHVNSESDVRSAATAGEKIDAGNENELWNEIRFVFWLWLRNWEIKKILSLERFYFKVLTAILNSKFVESLLNFIRLAKK